MKQVTRLLTEEAAYRAMATAKNPYGDGYAAERIVERIRCYFRELGTNGKAARAAEALVAHQRAK